MAISYAIWEIFNLWLNNDLRQGLLNYLIEYCNLIYMLEIRFKILRTNTNF